MFFAQSLSLTANQDQLGPLKLDPQTPIRSAISLIRGQSRLLIQTALYSTVAIEVRSTPAFKVMNKLLGTCPALVSVGIAAPKAVVGAKLPLKMRTSLLCSLAVLNQCQTD